MRSFTWFAAGIAGTLILTTHAAPAEINVESTLIVNNTSKAVKSENAGATVLGLLHLVRLSSACSAR